jgi:hypothetical protein
MRKHFHFHLPLVAAKEMRRGLVVRFPSQQTLEARRYITSICMYT